MNKEKGIKSYLNLLDYIKGKRKGSDANRIECEAMTDRFLCEALEGIDSVEDNHAENIENLHEKIMRRASKRNKYHRKIMIWGAAASINTIFTWSAAACVSLGIAGGLIYLSTSGSKNSGTELAISENNETYRSNDFIAKIRDSKKEIIEEEFLTATVIEPPLPKDIKIPEIKSNNINIIERNTTTKDIMNFAEDSIAAEKHIIKYVNPQKLEAETYVDENIPFTVVEEYPKFMGEDAKTFVDWVQKNIKYPDNGVCVSGRVVLSFVVTKDGDVANVNIIKKLSPEFDTEAVRVVSLSPKWTPAKQKNVPVDFEFTFPITFHIY
ncbi:MAG: energy transducer TonB [Prevotellaceae bacterium]|jgi:protein TonB|nr:energy transducer TonB [Prevotellaceae bacterium]